MQHCDSGWTAKDGLHLYAQCWRPETEPQAIVCLVHGLGEHGGRYVHVADALTRQGYALLAFDLRGHGKSGGARGHAAGYDLLMDDIAAFLDQAARDFPHKPLLLYGHSLGGGLVLNYVLRRKPELAGVIVSGPALKLAAKPSGATLALAKVLSRVAPAVTMASGLNRQGLAHDPAVIRAYSADPLVHDRISARLAMDMFQSGDWALAHAGEWTLPLLLLHGGDDPICSADGSRAFAASAHCTLKICDGLYHEIHNEPQQQEVFADVIGWLRAHA